MFEVVAGARPTCCAYLCAPGLFPIPLASTSSPNTYSCYILMSKASSTDGAEDQRAHTDEQPAPEQDNPGPPQDSGEQESSGPPAVESQSMIPNTGPSQSPEPHEQESTSKAASDDKLAPQTENIVAEKDQPNPSLNELASIMRQVLDVLQDSTIASKIGKDNRSRFWGVYRRVAEEHDGEFLERYTTDMDIVLIFSGLFSAVSTSFIVAMESNLSPDPSDTTNALLKQLVQIGLGNLAQAGPTPKEPASTWSPSELTLRIQMVVYASLSMSLLAAFGAVLGKQWLGYYKSHRYGRGSQEERGKRRQEKFDGLITWYFDAVVQSFPVLLQISLLLFGIALGANMWYEHPSIAWVIISTTVFGFLFFSLTVMACLISPACPFQTPMSTVLRMMRMDRVLRSMFEPASRNSQRLATSMDGVLQPLLATLRSSWARFSEALAGPIRATGAFAQSSLQPFFAALHKGLRSLVRHSLTEVVDSEAQPLDQGLDFLAENDDTLTLDPLDIPTGRLEAPSVMWLLKTSTDPEVFLAAARLVPQVEWPLDLDVSDMLHQLFDIFTSCVDIQKRIVPSLEEKASACTMALTHLYYGCILQAHPVRDTFPVCGMDLDVFEMIYWAGMRRTEHTVLDTTINLFFSNAIGSAWDSSLSEACPDSIPEQLSHLLPYHFVTGRVTKDIETLAITVISKLLSSPASPSNQIVANCTLLACVMVGTRVDKKDIVRIDKSSALPRLRESLSAQFQKALWAWDGGELDKYSTGIACRALSLLDIICRILELAEHSYDPPSSPFHTMRNLDACRKIYLRTRSSEHNHPSVSLGALRKALHFTFATATISWDHDRVWATQSWSERVSHSPEDFDWMVDYLDFIYSNDHEAAYDILLLLDIMGVWCSPAKQHLFIERLISCMDSNMPTYLRHAALRAAHGAREEIASIHTIDDARLRDIVLTKLSPTILSVLCPHPGTTLANDDPGPFFGRDKCYVELIFALARNSDWHPHLFGDRHIDWCISMLPEYYDSGYSAQIFYIAGILLQIAPEQTSVTSLSSVTEQQWWDLMSSAWNWIPDDFYNTRLLALVDGTKKYMQIASKSDLERFVWNVNRFLERLEDMGLEMQGLEQGEGITVAVKELRTTASNMLESFDQQLLVP